MDIQDLDTVAKELNIGGDGGDWLRFQTGDNNLRVVSTYEPLGQHFQGKGSPPVVCVGLKKNCEFCKNNKKPNVKFLCWVIDRNDNNLKLASLGWSVMKEIKSLSEDKEYGYPKGELAPYDINIKKIVINNGANLSDTSYKVIPARENKELTEEEKAGLKDLKTPTEIVDEMKNKVKKDVVDMNDDDTPDFLK